jgi:bacteriorhodopsin
VLGMRLTWNKRYITWHLSPPCWVWPLNSLTRKNCWVAKRSGHYLCADPNLYPGR